MNYLEGLIKYFDGVPDSLIDQEKGVLYIWEVGEDASRVCVGCHIAKHANLARQGSFIKIRSDATDIYLYEDGEAHFKAKLPDAMDYLKVHSGCEDPFGGDKWKAHPAQVLRNVKLDLLYFVGE